MAKAKQLRVTLVRSLCGRVARHKACVAGLGLRRMHHTVEVADTIYGVSMGDDGVSNVLSLDLEDLPASELI